MGDLFLGPLASQSTISRLENAPSKTHGGACLRDTDGAENTEIIFLL